MAGLRPFFRYYGGKWRAAPRYPAPRHATIIEPFAGSAGYSLRHPERNVILIEKYPVVAELWRYLISVRPEEIRLIPLGVEHIDDLPQWVPTPARSLLGWWFNNGTTSPCLQLSAGRKRLAAMGRNLEGWTEATRERIATQVCAIRHWKIIEGDYTSSPDIKATWFVDPPYNNEAGKHYIMNKLDYKALGSFCRERRGQVLVCENEGATWLPFRPFAVLKKNLNGSSGSREVVWEGGRE